MKMRKEYKVDKLSGGSLVNESDIQVIYGQTRIKMKKLIGDISHYLHSQEARLLTINVVPPRSYTKNPARSDLPQPRNLLQSRDLLQPRQRLHPGKGFHL